jgi:archaellum component FlaD/FlaE
MYPEEANDKGPHSELYIEDAHKFSGLNCKINQASEEEELTSQFHEADSDSEHEELPEEESAVESPFDLEVNVTQINEDSPSEEEPEASKVNLSEKEGIWTLS